MSRVCKHYHYWCLLSLITSMIGPRIQLSLRKFRTPVSPSHPPKSSKQILSPPPSLFSVALSLSARPAHYSARPAAADDVEVPFPPRHVHVRKAGLDEERHRREATELSHVVWDNKVATGAQCCVEHPE